MLVILSLLQAAHALCGVSEPACATTSGGGASYCSYNAALDYVACVIGSGATRGTALTVVAGSGANWEIYVSTDPGGNFCCDPSDFAAGAGDGLDHFLMTGAASNADEYIADGSVSAYPVTIYGANSEDLLIGSAQADTILGAGGRDEIYGGAGADFLRGEVGGDYIEGGDGADTIAASTAPPAESGCNDHIYGGSGNDTIYGDNSPACAKSDWIDGGLNNDTIYGYGGADILCGGPGTDTLLGHSGNDVLFGGTGADNQDGGGHSLGGADLCENDGVPVACESTGTPSLPYTTSCPAPPAWGP